MAGNFAIPDFFSGNNDQYPFEHFFAAFDRFCDYKHVRDEQKISVFRMLLKGNAARYFDCLANNDRDTIEHVRDAFRNRYRISQKSTQIFWENHSDHW